MPNNPSLNYLVTLLYYFDPDSFVLPNLEIPYVYSSKILLHFPSSLLVLFLFEETSVYGAKKSANPTHLHYKPCPCRTDGKIPSDDTRQQLQFYWLLLSGHLVWWS